MTNTYCDRDRHIAIEVLTGAHTQRTGSCVTKVLVVGSSVTAAFAGSYASIGVKEQRLKISRSVLVYTACS